MEASESTFGAQGVNFEGLGVSLGALRVVFGSPGPIFGALARIWSSLGVILWPFGCLQGALGPVLGVQGGLFGTSWEPRGCRRARFQFQPPHFDPPWAPKGANLTPKGGPNELQNCSKASSEVWLVTEIDF